MTLIPRLGAFATTRLATQAHAGGPVGPGEGPPAVHSRHVVVDGLRIFYREAGDPTLPHIVLLHGFPSSSHMYRKLIPLLARNFHVVAPDYPGFGHSDMPAPTHYRYSFDQLARTMDGFLQVLELTRYVLYMHDYGGPVGLRIASAHPERVAGLVVQNANAYEEGLSPDVMKVLQPFWAERTAVTEAPVRGFLTLDATRGQYVAGACRPDELDPDAWVFDQALLDRPGNQEIQLSLLADYGSNVALYPQWQRYLREYQPKTLIAWGRHDPFFLEAGAHAYLRDLPQARLTLLDSGHFALEEEAARVASEMLATYGSH
mgnify:CR=1 FL=1